MADELENKEVEVVEPEYSDVEKRAMEQGWKPKDQYDGDSDWTSAEIWLARTPLFEKIDSQKKELQSLKKTVTDLTEHHRKVEEVAYQRALKELQTRKREAIKDGDFELAADLEDEIDAHKQNVPKPTETQPYDAGVAFVNAWKGQNSWYGADTERTDLFDGFFLAKYNKNQDAEAAIKHAEAQLKKVENKKETPVSKVEDGGSPTKKVTSKNSKVELTEEETRVMRNFVRSGIMTEEQYKEEIKKTREQEV